MAKKLDAKDVELFLLENTDFFVSRESIVSELNFKHDESIIGGLVIQVGSIMIDSSIKNKLQKIQNKMVEA